MNLTQPGGVVDRLAPNVEWPHPSLLHQPILMHAVHPLHSALRLRRTGGNDANSQDTLLIKGTCSRMAWASLSTRDLVPRRPCSHAVPGTAARLDPDKIIAQTLQLVFYFAAARVAGGNHADNRSNADRDAQNGQDTAKPIAG
jgi:hypothetical protein